MNKRSVDAAWTGQVAVVTGASSGIGRALCLGLAARRARLVLAARDEDRLADVAEESRALGAETLVVATDLVSPEACERLIDRTIEHFGGLDTLFLNAGLSMRARFEEIRDLSIFDQLMRVNFLANVQLTHRALPALRQSRGRIVAVSSLTGLIGVPTRTGYAASKHAVIGFLESLRIELRGSGVSVTVAAPDFVRSEMQRRALGPDGRPRATTDLDEARIMTAEECAERILRAAARRQRLVVLSWRGRLARWLRLIAPGLVDSLVSGATTSRPENE